MINRVREMIDGSNNIVILSGSKTDLEAGLYGVRQESRAYDIENKYGYSPEEIATSDFFMRRVGLFYQFYKEEILDIEHIKPTETHHAAARLFKRGKLLTVVTRTSYGLYQMAGIDKIIELHGNINENQCPKCGKHYSAQYIKDSEGIPVCEQCKIVLRPGFALFGENIDNGKISKTADCVGRADMLLIVGASVDSYLSRYMLQYYQGDRLILINDERSASDVKANYILYGKCKDILPKLIP